MATINRREPPIVAQSLTDSCWAAAIDAWSQVDSRIPRQREAALIARYGEGPTGGITPDTKIPRISTALGIPWGGFAAGDLGGYLETHLPNSLVFCAYSVSGFLHAVMIYRFAERRKVSFMDQDGGRYASHSLNWFTQHGPYVLMRKS